MTLGLYGLLKNSIITRQWNLKAELFSGKHLLNYQSQYKTTLFGFWEFHLLPHYFGGFPEVYNSN